MMEISLFLQPTIECSVLYTACQWDPESDIGLKGTVMNPTCHPINRVSQKITSRDSFTKLVYFSLETSSSFLPLIGGGTYRAHPLGGLPIK